MRMMYLWLIVAGVTLFLELLSPLFLFVCFTGGALLAALASVWIDSVTIQAIIFAVSSVVFIPLTRPLARKMSRREATKTNVDALVGQTAYVLEEINAANNTGRVRVGSEEWRAVADTPVPKGMEVTVAAVEGAMVRVVRGD